ncbi:hypothetical protein [Blastococcus sp. SYSU DS0533]
MSATPPQVTDELSAALPGARVPAPTGGQRKVAAALARFAESHPACG